MLSSDLQDADNMPWLLFNIFNFSVSFRRVSTEGCANCWMSVNKPASWTWTHATASPDEAFVDPSPLGLLFCRRPLADQSPLFKQAIFHIYFYLVKADWAWTEHCVSASYGPTHSHPLRSEQPVCYCRAGGRRGGESRRTFLHSLPPNNGNVFISVMCGGAEMESWQEGGWRNKLLKMTASQTFLLYIHTLVKIMVQNNYGVCVTVSSAHLTPGREGSSNHQIY